MEKFKMRIKKKTIVQQMNATEFPFRMFDENNNEIYCEDSNGSWYKNEYDVNGNKIYYEYSDGYWYKKEFDKAGNVIYFEYSSGYWYKWEYDKHDNQIYYENSEGTIRDDRPKQVK